MTLPPLRRQVLVACDQATAYRLFVDDIGTWWPLESFGCFGADATVALDGDRFVETAPSGESAIWGTIMSSDAPTSVSFTWHPGGDPADATQVTVTFSRTGDNDTTLVTLEHSGWEALADAAAARARYAGGWPSVLDRFVGAEPASADNDSEYWLVLQHTVGPAAPADGVFASPDFPKHVQFLARLRDEGVLVAGGPLPDAPGNGMTIVRAPGAEQARRILTAAQDDDGSVTSGLLDVRVRPWAVAIAASFS